MDSIPVTLRPWIHRLEQVPDLSREELIAVLFVVRLGDRLHQSFYATFLLQSLVRQLAKKLNIPSLLVEVDVFVARWSFREGTVAVAHRIQWDYDMHSVFILSKIGRSVLKGTITAREGLRLIRDHENKPYYWKAENAFRDFPGRSLVIPLMSCTCATVFFGGTFYDLGFSIACGTASGLVAWMGASYEPLSGVADYLAATCTALISMAALAAMPDRTCFKAQVLGTLYWFLYGTAYVTSLYEITNNQLITGTTRFIFAVIRSYGLAFGVLFGVWLAWYDGPDRMEQIADEDCSTKDAQIPDYWYILLFPLSAIACLMQFRVGLNHFFICLVVQTVAYGSQYLLGTVWKQPEFLSNLVPAFLTTIASHVCIVLSHKINLSSLEANKDAYIQERKKSDEQEDDENVDAARNGDDDNHHKAHQTKLIAEGVVQDEGGVLVVEGDDHQQHHEDLPRGVTSAMSSSTIGYVSENGYTTRYYTDDDPLAHSRSDTWFCILPALYLLVPGAKVLETAFDSLWSNAVQGNSGVLRVDALASSLLTIGIGQVIGLRFGFTFLWLCAKICVWLDSCCCKSSTSSNSGQRRQIEEA